MAIKIAYRDRISAVEAEEFFHEARAAARLNHGNIVKVLELGYENGQAYIVQEFIDGPNLADWLAIHPVTPREAAAICLKVAKALEHAHQASVVHRDLKPSNILIAADGEPHLVDFGLAKREPTETSITIEGRILGTPAYMAPEQARGDSHAVDHHPDLYSLGVVLFEMLTGECPFRGNLVCFSVRSWTMMLRRLEPERLGTPRSRNDLSEMPGEGLPQSIRFRRPVGG